MPGKLDFLPRSPPSVSRCDLPHGAIKSGIMSEGEKAEESVASAPPEKTESENPILTSSDSTTTTEAEAEAVKAPTDISSSIPTSAASLWFFDEAEFSCLHLAIVFEELSDRLSTLTPGIELRSVPSTIYEEQHNRPVFHLDPGNQEDEDEEEEEHFILKQNYHSVITRRVDEKSNPPAQYGRPKRLSKVLKFHGVDQHTESGRNKGICARLQQVVTDVVKDLVQNSAAQPLFDEVERVTTERRTMVEKYTKIVDDLARIQNLKKEIKATKQNHVIEVQMLNIELWNIHNKFLESGARRPMEDTYVTHFGKASVASGKRKIVRTERLVEEELEDAKKSVAAEHQDHEAMMKIVTMKLTDVTAKLDYWMDKYERDYGKLCSELDQMKKNRRNGLERMAWLKKMIPDYSEIVADDRRIKELEKSRERKKVKELKNCIKIQAWWKGTMVRKRLGVYKHGVFPVRKGGKPLKKGEKAKDAKKK